MAGPVIPLAPVWRSLGVAACALVLVAPPAIAIAYAGSRRRYRGRTLVETLVLLPLVLPPTVVGYLLVVVLGPRGLVGAGLARLGIVLMFSPLGAVVASATVALPLIERTAEAAFAGVDPEYERVARTLGHSPLAVFRRVTLPLAARGLVAAMVLGLARALGEFGATLMFAGDVPGRTRTMPLALYDAYLNGDRRTALFMTAVLAACSIGVVMAAGSLTRRRP